MVQFISDFPLLSEVGWLGVLCGSNDSGPNQVSFLFSLLLAKQRPVFVRRPLGRRGIFSLLGSVVLMANLLSPEMLEISRLINERIVIFTHPLFKLRVRLLCMFLRTASTQLRILLLAKHLCDWDWLHVLERSSWGYRLALFVLRGLVLLRSNDTLEWKHKFR